MTVHRRRSPQSKDIKIRPHQKSLNMQDEYSHRQKTYRSLQQDISRIIETAVTRSSDEHQHILRNDNNITHTLQSTLADRTRSHEESSSELQAIAQGLNLSSLSSNYYGFVTGGCTPAALEADFYTSLYDQNVQVHLPRETAATEVEAVALNMMLDLFLLPRDQWGIGGEYSGCGSFTTGATASNIIGLALGREYVLAQTTKTKGRNPVAVNQDGLHAAIQAAGVKELVVLSTMPHSSISKAASIVGIGRSNIVPVGTSLSVDLRVLENEISKPDRAHILALSMGEVNTGRFATSSIDQMLKIRSLCDKYNVWIHVDGAFGLFGRLLKSSARLAEYTEIVNGCLGLELADSITGDAHKLLNVPYDAGVYFTRHKSLAPSVFSNGTAAYLTSSATGDGLLSPLNIGMENSRRFRALPVYATLYRYGRAGYVEMLERQIALCRRIAAWMYDSDEYVLLPSDENREQMIAKTFMIVLFRSKHAGRNEGLVRRINASGKMYVSGTTWNGEPAARIAVSNWQASPEKDGPLIEAVLTDCGRM